jgi:hypothetical protein
MFLNIVYRNIFFASLIFLQKDPDSGKVLLAMPAHRECSAGQGVIATFSPLKR